MVGLSKALRVFEDEGLNLVHIESRKVKGSKDKVLLPSNLASSIPILMAQTELYLEIDSEESEDWNKIQHVIDTLRGVDLCPNDSVTKNILDICIISRLCWLNLKHKSC